MLLIRVKGPGVCLSFGPLEVSKYVMTIAVPYGYLCQMFEFEDIRRKNFQLHRACIFAGGFYSKPGFLTKSKYKVKFGMVKFKMLFENCLGTQQIVMYVC